MAAKVDKLTLSGLSQVREARKATPLGKALPFSTWLKVAGYEKIERETRQERR
jgi:hypothetical protein